MAKRFKCATYSLDQSLARNRRVQSPLDHHQPGGHHRAFPRGQPVRRQPRADAGRLTSLPITEEFRCLIAALYGRGYADGKSRLHGSVDAADVALRCAHYGRIDLTLKEMKSGYERDKDVYVFAALYNSNIMFKRELRKLFEEEQLTSDLSKKYLKHSSNTSQVGSHLGSPACSRGQCWFIYPCAIPVSKRS